MELITSIIAVILVFGVIVIVHEWGHMQAARLCGIAVPDFALGMGPSLVSWKMGQTRYHLCAFPIGGFVRIAGLEGDDSLDGRKFPPEATWQSKNGWQKAFVLVAGPLMNFLLAIVLMMVIGFEGFPRTEVLIGQVQAGSPAEAAGIQLGDRIASIGGTEILSVEQVRELIVANGEKPMALEVERKGQLIPLSATPRILPEVSPTQVSLGIGMSPVAMATTKISLVQPKTAGYKAGLRRGDTVTTLNGQTVSRARDIYDKLPLSADDAAPEELIALNLMVTDRKGSERAVEIPAGTDVISLGALFEPQLEKLPLGQSLARSMEDSVRMFVGTITGIQMMFSRSDAASQLSGPVGIVSLIQQSAQSGWYLFLQIVIMINISIGLLNLMPFPALDGGRLVFVALNGIGLRISERREAIVHTVGMVMLLGLILIITVTDVGALFNL